MKIIEVDNFDRDSVDDIVVAENIRSKQYGKVMTDALITKFSTVDGQSYFRLVEDDYKLKRWEP